jgi:hypothetical protein
MRKAVISAVFITAISFSSLLFSTAQQGDKLVLNGKTYTIYTNPLSPFLEKNPGRIPQSNIRSTSLWRGYVASWQVKDDRLVLTDIAILQKVTKPGDSGFSSELVSVMSTVFPGQKEVPADWFTGHIIVPDGKLVEYVHMGYASMYEKYVILRVEHGLVTRNLKTDTAGFAKFRDAQFAAYKKTEEYRKALAETAAEGKKDGGMSASQNEEFLREFYSERYMSMIFEEAR